TRGVTVVTCRATDGANVSSCTFSVTVNDVEPPTVHCPANITVTTSGTTCSSNVTFTATASDNCGSPAASCVPPSGSAFNVGTTTVTCTANDGNGNSGSCAFNV